MDSLETTDAGKVNIKTAQVVKEAKSGKKKDAAKVGIATGIGAAIGAIAGGGKGAAIGAGAGAAGGTGLVFATKGAAAEIPAESVLTFRLAAPVTVQERDDIQRLKGVGLVCHQGRELNADCDNVVASAALLTRSPGSVHACKTLIGPVPPSAEKLKETKRQYPNHFITLSARHATSWPELWQVQ